MTVLLKNIFIQILIIIDIQPLNSKPEGILKELDYRL